jgi:3-phenylpropionate/trans-cinnamate dioxygenase ferredoxin reductase subunit
MSRLRAPYFEELYAREADPWDFATSDYEAAKYEATIAALDPPYASALEVGCSIGVLTERLAGQCDRLLAVDVAAAALVQARRRVPAVRFERREIPEEWPDEPFDLIVCSEVLYYLDDAALDQTLGLIERTLVPSGSLLAVHWRHPTRTSEHRVEVRLGVTMSALGDEVRLEDGTTLPFDVCILATGARPRRLFDGPQTLRWLADARELMKLQGRATVIGSGFIGCEAAASLAMKGLDVTLVTDEDLPQQARLGEAAGRRIAGWLMGLGVTLRTGEQATEGTLMAVGIESPRIEVDAGMRTAREHVFAAGDAVRAHNAGAGRALAVEHWGEALNMGEIAGRNAAGEDRAWDVAPGFWSMIGTHTLKYVAWGDGFDEARMVEHAHGAFTVWYGREGVTVGVLTHARDEDYERGRTLVETGALLP